MDSPLIRNLCRVAALAVLLGAGQAARAQDFSFFYRTAPTASLIPVLPNGNITAPPGAIGSSGAFTFVITNDNDLSWIISRAVVTGPAFALAQDPTGMVSVSGSSVAVPLTFAPKSAGDQSGSLTITLAGGGKAEAFTFFLNGVGQQPTFLTSYVIQPAGNQVAVDNGGTLKFPATNVGSSTSATVSVSNTGTGPGIIDSVAVTGASFAVSGLTLLPATIQPNGGLQFTLTFQPTARGAAAGTLNIGTAGGNPISIQLTGQGAGASLTYSAGGGSQASALTPGATFALPSTNVGSSTSAVITITNGGDAAANIAGVSVTGAGYSVTNVPPMPATVNPGRSFTFTLSFNPQASGTAAGILSIGTATFPLSTVALGANLTYTSAVGSATLPLTNGGTLVFPNTNLGSTSNETIRVTNNGNTAANVGGISVTGAGFSVSGLPALPVTLNPGDSLQFNVAFTPPSTTTSTGTLSIDSFAASLRGTVNQPQAISGLVFGSLPANPAAMQQPAVSLALSKPYPLPLNGTLTMTFASRSFADDPNIQFASGGRTVNFTIPANSLNAVFPSGSQVQFQTGTVAGVITLAASLRSGSVDLTPDPAPSSQMTIAAAPPVLTNVRLGATTANSFEVLVTGYATSREVSTIDLQFTAAPGTQLQTTTLSFNTEATFQNWFQSQTGISFGSQFTASVIVNVNGTAGAIQSVAVTASNSQGQSAPVSLTLNLH